jgi:hypothetical protein
MKSFITTQTHLKSMGLLWVEYYKVTTRRHHPLLNSFRLLLGKLPLKFAFITFCVKLITYHLDRLIYISLDLYPSIFYKKFLFTIHMSLFMGVVSAWPDEKQNLSQTDQITLPWYFKMDIIESTKWTLRLNKNLRMSALNEKNEESIWV